MATPYFILTGLIDGQHELVFGDYDQEVVEQEREDIRDQYEGTSLRVRRVADDSQASIDAKLAKLNKPRCHCQYACHCPAY